MLFTSFTYQELLLFFWNYLHFFYILLLRFKNRKFRRTEENVDKAEKPKRNFHGRKVQKSSLMEKPILPLGMYEQLCTFLCPPQQRLTPLNLLKT